MIAGAGIRIAISPGELIDRISILRLKRERFTDSERVQRVVDELNSLEEAYRQRLPVCAEVDSLAAALAEINRSLWHVEDAIRFSESAGDFGPESIAQARAICQLNDRRSAIKPADQRASRLTVDGGKAVSTKPALQAYPRLASPT